MNAVRGVVERLSALTGVKRALLLFAFALVFALPFVTKSACESLPLFSVCAVFGWCGLSPLFADLLNFEKTLKRVFCSLFCFFFAFYFFAYSWFAELYPLDFAGLGNIESVGVIVIAETLIPLLHSAIMSVCLFVSYLAAKNVKSDCLRAVLLSSGYVLGEYMQSVGTLAFPWARLFVGQTVFLPLLQSASLFGSYFITFLMVLVNVLLALAILKSKTDNKKSRALLLAAICVFCANFAFGAIRMGAMQNKEYDRTVSAVILQGNISSGDKWSAQADEIEIYTELAETVKATNADIAVMPETAFPITLNLKDGFVSQHEKALVRIAEELDATLFAGAFSREGGKEYNSIFAATPDCRIIRVYDKKNLVPFGEFLPCRSVIEKVFPWLAGINMLSGDISQGGDSQPFRLSAGNAAFLVCFDSIFPENARQQVKNGGEFIVISTNDSWYKTSCAIYQHADHAIMRAIENNVPVIRCANTGISRIIDASGKVLLKTRVNERVAVCDKVGISGSCTLYTRIGDVFVLLSAVAVFGALIFYAIKKPSAKTKGNNC